MSTGGWIAIAVVAVILLIVIILICWSISARNNFVRMRSEYEEAFSSVDIQLKKRYDLIPNLVETVKGYAKHESETLEKVIAARNHAVNANTTADKIEADAEVSSAIKNFNIVAERYPDLKANVNFNNLSNQLTNIEDQLSEYRRYYNAKVKAFNTAREVFPKSIIAGWMNLQKQPYFQLTAEEERNAPKVQF